MPSILTLDGVSVSTDPPTKPKKKKRLTRAQRGLGAPDVGECQPVDNPRTGTTTQLCFFGRDASTPTGWRFLKKGEEKPRRR
jgi:hypothetical protein